MAKRENNSEKHKVKQVNWYYARRCTKCIFLFKISYIYNDNRYYETTYNGRYFSLNKCLLTKKYCPCTFS